MINTENTAVTEQGSDATKEKTLDRLEYDLELVNQTGIRLDAIHNWLVKVPINTDDDNLSKDVESIANLLSETLTNLAQVYSILSNSFNSLNEKDGEE